jgi:hypothetical protein
MVADASYACINAPAVVFMNIIAVDCIFSATAIDCDNEAVTGTPNRGAVEKSTRRNSGEITTEKLRCDFAKEAEDALVLY